MIKIGREDLRKYVRPKPGPWKIGRKRTTRGGGDIHFSTEDRQ